MARLRREQTVQRGQALMEFALIAPLLLVLLLAVVDFGIAINRRIVLDHAVREGARFAAVGGQALTTGVPATREEIAAYTLDQSQGIADTAEVCYEDANGSGTLGDVGDSVRVSIRYTHEFVTGFTGLLDGSPIRVEMSPSASARVERVAEDTTPCTG